MEERQERRDGKIIERDIEKEMRTADIDYALSAVIPSSCIEYRILLCTGFNPSLTSGK